MNGQEKIDEFHMLERDLAALSKGVQLQPSKEFTNHLMEGISTPRPVQIYWLETPLRAAAAILLLATFIGLNAFSLKSITELSGNAIQPSEQEFLENEFSMEDLGWLSADYPQIVSE